jgi:hypothetical protein
MYGAFEESQVVLYIAIKDKIHIGKGRQVGSTGEMEGEMSRRPS